MSTFSPTPQQTLAIDYTESMVITACPGSGKTTVIKEKIRNITDGLPEHKGVIAITFTRKASSELERRCKADGHDVKNSFFGTIDSFCLNDIIIPFLSRIWGGKPRECKVLKKLESPFNHFIEKNFSGTPSITNINEDPGYKKLYDEGILWMGSFSALALKIINESPAAKRYIKARYSHIFIDEYQDSSLSQHELFLRINELGLCSIAVGDVWQSIYEFRGGNSELLLELVSNTECFKHFEINFNHRCHPSISNYASRLLDPSYILLPADEIRIFRRRLDGNLKDAAVTISPWISGWLSSGEWKLEKANQIAILARKEKSLILFCSGLNLNFRLYVDTPLDKIGTDCSDLYKDLLAYKYGSISTAQEFINKVFDGVIVDDNTMFLLRKKIKAIRNELKNEDLIHMFHDIADILGINSTEHIDGALIRTISDDILVKQFKPLDDNEIQVMTLHKSKGLEFKLVFHLDLDEWSFPYREYNSEDRHTALYPTLQQEINLHYVGITRAENCCILINSSLRQNASGNFKNADESYFFKLPQLDNLYS
ncbi:UvrD-helicase domain-containing protein [Trabulsiella odontotermitis]|uniref:UvrD-helicase domain-containing protein n=1 Tax=Trabulsiella odontotermitis TaxID=379893 RepID=UPI00067633C1|nr:ATP-dependent helicase [Trabulsiella odontotermitis]KNC92266.1 DNA helicase UvrD [Trabulsiella odontotermitis]